MLGLLELDSVAASCFIGKQASWLSPSRTHLKSDLLGYDRWHDVLAAELDVNPLPPAVRTSSLVTTMSCCPTHYSSIGSSHDMAATGPAAKQHFLATRAAMLQLSYQDAPLNL